MKNRKWLTYTFGILLTVVAFVAVGGAGFRIGMMQNTPFAHPALTRGFDGMPQVIQENSRNDGKPQVVQENFQRNGNPHAMQSDFDRAKFDNRDRDRRGGGMPFFSPIFWVIRLTVLGLLFWLGYKYVKSSGWKLTRVQASPAPTVTETPKVEVEDEQASE